MSLKKLFPIFLILVVLALTVATQAPAVADVVQTMRAGRPLLYALLTRAEIGDLALGPDTPMLWALARAPDLTQQTPGTAELRLAADDALAAAVTGLADVNRAARLAGIAFGSQGKYSEAEARLAAGQAQDGADPFLWLATGNVLDEQGRRVDAVWAWTQVDVVRGISYQLYREGMRQASQGRRDKAEQMLLLATEVDPTFADPFHALGGFYWGSDDEKSVEMYRRSLAVGGLDPFFAALAEGKLALLDEQPEQAIAPLQEAVALRPDHADANHFLGQALFRAGRSEEAIPYLTRSAELNTSAPWSLIELGKVYLALDRYDQAVDALTQAIGRRADQVQPYMLLAEAHQLAGRVEQAAAAWQQVVALKPQNVSHRLHLADLWLQAGRPEEAIAAYQAALVVAPDNAYAQRQLERLGVAPAKDGS